jgi:hypothetical protein
LINSICDQVTVLWGTKFVLLEFWANESVGTQAAAAVCSKVLLDWMVMLQFPFLSCFAMWLGALSLGLTFCAHEHSLIENPFEAAQCTRLV